MAIKIEKVGDLFTAEITPPHGRGIPWKSGKPMDLDKLIEQLLLQGCHQTDIGDVLYEIDPRLIGEKKY